MPNLPSAAEGTNPRLRKAAARIDEISTLPHVAMSLTKVEQCDQVEAAIAELVALAGRIVLP